jgi:hypothetical protein
MNDALRQREIESVKADFLEGEEAIFAIERLQALGMSPKEAEALVESWETE